MDTSETGSIRINRANIPYQFKCGGIMYLSDGVYLQKNLRILDVYSSIKWSVVYVFWRNNGELKWVLLEDLLEGRIQEVPTKHEQSLIYPLRLYYLSLDSMLG